MAEPATNWFGIAGVISATVVAFGSFVALFKWFFSRGSTGTIHRLHQEQLLREDNRHHENLQRFDGLSGRLFALESPIARMDDRLRRAEQDILDLREWKHTKGDPYIGAVEVLKARVDALARIER